ncbi:DUF4432 family protein, partial [Klebsiella pneumoniae]|uniref:DUF4432 family protein n=1 Tax=Klebsiella pneumoniae TaxID=573 RepID=UPI001F2A6DE4
FKKADLQTLTELRYVPGSNSFSLHDVLTNHADYPHDYQIIYHINFDGTLSSWWTKIAIGILLFIFIALQRGLTVLWENRQNAAV